MSIRGCTEIACSCRSGNDKHSVPAGIPANSPAPQLPPNPLRYDAAGAPGEAMDAATQITQLLKQAESGDAASLAAVFESLYPELRRLAAARLRGAGHTITPTVLVHEFYLRLSEGQGLSLSSRRHFFAAAAKAMRWIVVDQARRRGADKRGGGLQAVTLSERMAAAPDDAEILALHEGLEVLDRIDPRRREVVELRYFVGLEFSEVAELLECSERTAKRDWARARALLHALLADAASGDGAW